MKSIIINGRQRNFPGTDVSYAEICRLAFLVTLPRLQVLYTTPDQPEVQQMLTPVSNRLPVVDGMRFEVEQLEYERQ